MAKKDAILELMEYIAPILNIGDVSIAEDRSMYFDDPSSVFKTEEGKVIVYPMSYHEWGKLRKNENNEVFNPFVVKKHMLFLASLTANFLEELNTEYEVDSKGFVVPIGDKIEVRTVSFKEPSGLIHFQFVISEGSKQSGDYTVLHEGTWPEEKMAIWIACMNALRSYYMGFGDGSTALPEHLQFLQAEPINLVPKINLLLERMAVERRKVIGEDRSVTELSELSLFEDNYKVRELNDADFIGIDESKLPKNFAMGVDDLNEIEDEESIMCLPKFKDIFFDSPEVRLKFNVVESMIPTPLSFEGVANMINQNIPERSMPAVFDDMVFEH